MVTNIRVDRHHPAGALGPIRRHTGPAPAPSPGTPPPVPGLGTT